MKQITSNHCIDNRQINKNMKNAKKIICTSCLAAIIVGLGAPKTILGFEGDSNKNSQSQEARQALKETRDAERATIQKTNLDLRKTNANKEIDRRIASLYELINKINSVKRLSTEQKESLSSQVKIEITNLESLKVKISEDTELDSLKVHKQEIVNSYRIYALFLPKINIIIHASEINSLATLMDSKNTNVEAKTKISNVITKTNQVIEKMLALTPAGYPGNKTDMNEAKTTLRDARTELNAARVLMKKSSE